MARYSHRYDDGLIPTVVVTLREYQPVTKHGRRTWGYADVPVKTFRGLTMAHASRRALRWTRSHGDPR